MPELRGWIHHRRLHKAAADAVVMVEDADDSDFINQDT
jgi:hypothetical protein